MRTDAPRIARRCCDSVGYCMRFEADNLRRLTCLGGWRTPGVRHLLYAQSASSIITLRAHGVPWVDRSVVGAWLKETGIRRQMSRCPASGGPPGACLTFGRASLNSVSWEKWRERWRRNGEKRELGLVLGAAPVFRSRGGRVAQTRHVVQRPCEGYSRLAGACTIISCGLYCFFCLIFNGAPSRARAWPRYSRTGQCRVWGWLRH